MSIQYGSGIAAKGYTPSPVRTGMERVVAHRTGDLFAQTAKQPGKVVELTDTHVTVEYKDGSRHTVELGRRFGSGAGLVFPHELVSPLKMGQSIKAGDVISYNTSYFEPDPLNPSEVLLKTTMQAKTVLWESPDTLEDSSSISASLAKRLEATTTKRREILVDFDTVIRNPRKVGAEVDYDDVLCVLEEPTTHAAGDVSEAALATLQKIASKAPKAKSHGVLERIEVLYNGELEDMSESLKALAKASDKRIRVVAKAKGQKVTSGRVDNSMRIGKDELSPNTAALIFYVTGPEPAGVGDYLLVRCTCKGAVILL